MISSEKVLAVIPARGGSKGLPHKNNLVLRDKPMIGWTIDSARSSTLVDRVVLSSDDAEIIDGARRFGCDVPFTRPAKLATDQASTLDVALHALEQLPGYDILVVLQPTSPLRRAEDIDGALQHMVELDANSCISVTEPAESPYWALGMNEQGRLHPLFDPQLARRRRQELPKAFMPNGAIFAVRVAHFVKTHRFVDDDTAAFVMPKERSVDIDDAFDFKLVEFLIKDQSA